jgi:hypothetical protein
LKHSYGYASAGDRPRCNARFGLNSNRTNRSHSTTHQFTAIALFIREL